MVSLCTFELGGQRFGLHTARVQEVVRVDRLTPVPRAPAELRGLMNLRGMIVLAVDAAQRLQLDAAAVSPPASADGDPAPPRTRRILDAQVAVVLPSPDGPMALLVDDVHEVTEVDEALFEPAADRVGGVDASLVAGAYRTDGQLTLLLDADRVLRCVASTEREPTEPPNGRARSTSARG